MYSFSQCLACVHYEGQIKNSQRQGCKAFPTGIPEKIWSNEVVHDKPLKGDGGIVFERRPASPREEEDEF
jgi:hypothetical protein